MQTFQIYRVVSTSHSNRKQGPKMEIAVLTVRNVGGQATMRSVNRHVEMVGGQWIGRHPDFYDGVDAKNARSEEMFTSLENELEKLTKKLEALDEEINQWVEDPKLGEFADNIAKRFNLNYRDLMGLLGSIRLEVVGRLRVRREELMAEAINVGVKKEHAKSYLADVQRDFPRVVEYTGLGSMPNLAPRFK